MRTFVHVEHLNCAERADRARARVAAPAAVDKEGLIYSSAAMVEASLVEVRLSLPLIGEGVEGRCLCQSYVRITMLAPTRQHDDTSVDLSKREIAHLPLERT